MSDRKFKLGLDVHGVIDVEPELFSELSRRIIEGGGEVHIITGGAWTPEFEQEVRGHGVSWTHHFSVYDHLLSLNMRTQGEVKFPDGKIQKKFIDGVWDPTKGKYCEDNSIDLHIDDTVAYREYFSTPFLLHIIKK